MELALHIWRAFSIPLPDTLLCFLLENSVLARRTVCFIDRDTEIFRSKLHVPEVVKS